MKTKTQLKNTNQKLSLAMKRAWKRRREQGTARVVKQPSESTQRRSTAMKKSWAERRNSPMREQARQRELAKLNEFIPRKGPKKVTQRVTDVVVEAASTRVEERLAQVADQLGAVKADIAKLYARTMTEYRGPNIRRQIATHMMSGLLAGSLINPLALNRQEMAKKAYEMADALIDAEGT